MNDNNDNINDETETTENDDYTGVTEPNAEDNENEGGIYSYSDEEPQGGETDHELSETPEIELTREMAEAEYFMPEDEKKRFAEELFEWIEIFSSALFMVILIFTFVFRLVTVQGPSMQETLHGKDNLIISNLAYTPKQGDIVVIQVPNPNFPTPIIKRVIATEGQYINIDFEKWEVTIYKDENAYNNGDGVVLDEPYVHYEPGRFMNSENMSADSMPIIVEPGKIFVMGDNRNQSSDSRRSEIGQIDRRNVVGRVLIRVYPIDKFGVVKPNES